MTLAPFFTRTYALSVGFKMKPLRGCSYGSELVGLGRLAHLGEISLFLKNCFKKLGVFI